MAKGIRAFDILAYRHGKWTVRSWLVSSVPPSTPKVCIAGSISNFKRIDTMFDIGPGALPWAAPCSQNFVPEGSFRDNLKLSPTIWLQK